MNLVNETISFEKARCREIYVPDLKSLLQSQQMKLWSWGARGFTVDDTLNTRMFRMRVSGHHHKGHVYIFLNGLDLFDVYLTTLQGKIKQRTDESGIYADQLIDWIDERVERISEYQR